MAPTYLQKAIDGAKKETQEEDSINRGVAKVIAIRGDGLHKTFDDGSTSFHALVFRAVEDYTTFFTIQGEGEGGGGGEDFPAELVRTDRNGNRE